MHYPMKRLFGYFTQNLLANSPLLSSSAVAKTISKIHLPIVMFSVYMSTRRISVANIKCRLSASLVFAYA